MIDMTEDYTVSSKTQPVNGKTAPVLMRFVKLVTPGNTEIVRRKIEAKYGFSPSLAYCRDLVKFVDEMTSNVTGDQEGT